MIKDYLVELIGSWPAYLDGLFYIFAFLLLMFGLYVICYIITIFFSPFFRR